MFSGSPKPNLSNVILRFFAASALFSSFPVDEVGLWHRSIQHFPRVLWEFSKSGRVTQASQMVFCSSNPALSNVVLRFFAVSALFSTFPVDEVGGCHRYYTTFSTCTGGIFQKRPCQQACQKVFCSTNTA